MRDRIDGQLAAVLIIYVALSSAGADINHMVIWTTEAVAFLSMSLFGLILLVRSNSNGAAWIAVVLAGIFNIVLAGTDQQFSVASS